MPLKYDTSYTVEFYGVWQHPMGPIFNIGDKAGLSKAHAESVEARGVGKIIRRPEKAVEAVAEPPVKEEVKEEVKAPVNKDVKSPAYDKQVKYPKTK